MLGDSVMRERSITSTKRKWDCERCISAPTFRVVKIVRDSGATKIYLVEAAPPAKFLNVYGIDMPAASEFISPSIGEGRIVKYIGADWVAY
ncbi:MAG: hypothetical protein VXZ77_05790 [Pseudomonadota bacterium]|nr:hypothetical protein [Pseudomonadota bacterium]